MSGNTQNKSDHTYILNQGFHAPQWIFYGVWLIIFIISIIILARTQGNPLSTLVFNSGNDSFMDFFNHIAYVSEHGIANVYKQSLSATFPPLIYLLYYFFDLILPKDVVVMYSSISTSSYAMLLYVWYCVFVAAVLCVTVMKMLSKLKLRHQYSMIGIIITSNIFIFGVLERGNSVILACLFLMWAVMLHGSKEKYKQELALIMIAIAASIKIYPAVFGMIYIFEKQWSKAARLILYGICFFFIPFCFCGGWDGFCTFLSNQITLQNEDFINSISIKSAYNHIAGQINFNYIKGIGDLLTVIYFIIALLMSYVHKTTWKRIYLLTCTMILCPFWSGNYTLILLSIPLILFMVKEHETVVFSAMNNIYAALFALIFSFCTFSDRVTGQLLNLPSAAAINYIPIYIINVLLICEGLRKIYKRGRNSHRIQHIRQ